MNRSSLAFVGAASFALALATLPCLAAPTDDAGPDSSATIERIVGAQPVDSAPHQRLAALASSDENQVSDNPPESSERDSSGFHPPLSVSLGMVFGSLFLIVKRMMTWASRRSLQAGRDYDAKIRSSDLPWDDRGLRSAGFNEGSVDKAIADALARRGGGY